MESYVKKHYGAPDDIGRKVEYKGRTGIIFEFGGNYVSVNFDDQKPGITSMIHPTDPDLKYLEMGEIRQMTRSQKKYREYINADFGCSFAEYLGIQKVKSDLMKRGF